MYVLTGRVDGKDIYAQSDSRKGIRDAMPIHWNFPALTRESPSARVRFNSHAGQLGETSYAGASWMQVEKKGK